MEVIDPSSKWREPVLVFLFWLFFFALFNNGFNRSDHVYQYKVAERIVSAGEISLLPPCEHNFVLSPNGRCYAGHEIGNALLMVPVAYANSFFKERLPQVPAKRLIEFELNLLATLYASLGLGLFFLLMRDVFGQSSRHSFYASALLALTTFYSSASQNIDDVTLCSLILIFSVYLLFRIKQESHYEPVLMGAFLILGFGFITRISMAAPILAAIFYIIFLKFKRFEIKNILLIMLALFPAVAWQFYYNFIRTGNLLLSPLQTPSFPNSSMDNPVLIGMAGLIFSPGKGILVYAPLLILTIFFLKKFYSNYKPESVFLFSTFLFWTFLHSKLRIWYGAWGWGPRHFLTVLPILFIPTGIYFKEMLHSKWMRPIFFILSGWGFLIFLSGILVDWHYRMSFINQTKSILTTEWVWSFTSNQAVDAITALFHIFQRFFTSIPYDVVAGASELHVKAANTVNIWPSTFILAGYSPAGTFLAAAVFLVMIFGLFLRIQKTFRAS